MNIPLLPLTEYIYIYGLAANPSVCYICDLEVIETWPFEIPMNKNTLMANPTNEINWFLI